MNSKSLSFNLIDEPWIRAQTKVGVLTELSIRELFQQANELGSLVGSLPTQVFAIERLLLAIVHRATQVSDDEWSDWWAAKQLPLTQIDEYLNTYHHRFNLLDDKFPFYQVANLHTQKGEMTELDRLILDSPDSKRPFLMTRSPQSLQKISFAEAARWLINCQAFDTSGIKSGAVGDSRVKGGKGYPIGVGAAGTLGGILLEGENQFETLLLNLVPQNLDAEKSDFATWELGETAATVADTSSPRHQQGSELPMQPRGRAELLTWQSRRVRLAYDDDGVTEVLICNGDRFSPVSLEGVEPMTAWRPSPTQAKRLKIEHASMPKLHDPSRQPWRGLEALLALQRSDKNFQAPLTISRLVANRNDSIIDSDYTPHVRTIGVIYINQASSIDTLIDEVIPLPVRVIRGQSTGLQTAVLKSVADTESAVRAYGTLHCNISRAGGNKDDLSAIRDAAQAAAFNTFDPRFRQWLASLRDPALDPFDALDQWANSARQLILALGEHTLENAGDSAWGGRMVELERKTLRVTSYRAHAWFRGSIFKIFPIMHEIPKETA